MAKKSGLDKFKMEVAKELGIDIQRGPDLTTREAGKVGGNMVRIMIDRARQDFQ